MVAIRGHHCRTNFAYPDLQLDSLVQKGSGGRGRVRCGAGGIGTPGRSGQVTASRASPDPERCCFSPPFCVQRRARPAAARGSPTSDGSAQAGEAPAARGVPITVTFPPLQPAPARRAAVTPALAIPLDLPLSAGGSLAAAVIGGSAAGLFGGGGGISSSGGPAGRAMRQPAAMPSPFSASAASPAPRLGRAGLGLGSEDLEALLGGRTPAGQRLLCSPTGGLLPSLQSAPSALGGSPRPRRSRSVELPEALLARPGSPSLHKLERPALKLRQGSRGRLGGAAASGLALTDRSCSSPVLQMQAAARHTAGAARGSACAATAAAATAAPPVSAAMAAAAAAAEGAMAAAVAAAVAVAAPELRRLTSNQSEVTGGGRAPVLASPGGPHADDLEWLLGRHPASAVEAREFELLFPGGSCGGGGGLHLLAPGTGLSPTAGLLFSPGTGSRILSPRFRL